MALTNWLFWTMGESVDNQLHGWVMYEPYLNPVSKPPNNGAQGLAKEDWVTVWFFCLNVKTTISPALAFYDMGDNCQIMSGKGR